MKPGGHYAYNARCEVIDCLTASTAVLGLTILNVTLGRPLHDDRAIPVVSTHPLLAWVLIDLSILQNRLLFLGGRRVSRHWLTAHEEASN